MRHKLHAHWTLRAALHVVRFVGRVCCVMNGICGLCGLCGHRVPFVPQREEHLRRVGEFDFGRPVGGLHHTVVCRTIGCIAATSVACCMVYVAAPSDKMFMPLSGHARLHLVLCHVLPRDIEVGHGCSSPRHVSHVAHRRHTTRRMLHTVATPRVACCTLSPCHASVVYGLSMAAAAVGHGGSRTRRTKQCFEQAMQTAVLAAHKFRRNRWSFLPIPTYVMCAARTCALG